MSCASSGPIGAGAYVGLVSFGFGMPPGVVIAAIVTFALREAAIIFDIPSPRFAWPAAMSCNRSCAQARRCYLS